VGIAHRINVLLGNAHPFSENAFHRLRTTHRIKVLVGIAYPFPENAFHRLRTTHRIKVLVDNAHPFPENAFHTNNPPDKSFGGHCPPYGYLKIRY
jgi:hypothetical protein